MEILLNNELKKIVDENVDYFKNDLDLDLEILLDKNYECDNYIFLVRDAGTHLYPKEFLTIKDSYSRIEFLHFKNRFKRAYEVKVSKRGRKNVYGTVEEIPLDKLISYVSNNEEDYEKTSVRLIKKDGNILETIFFKENSYYESLSLNNLDYNDVDKMYVLKYLK